MGKKPVCDEHHNREGTELTYTGSSDREDFTGSILLAKCRRTCRCCAGEEGMDEVVVLVSGDDTMMEGADD